jgi:hypothetical protein
VAVKAVPPLRGRPRSSLDSHHPPRKRGHYEEAAKKLIA